MKFDYKDVPDECWVGVDLDACLAKYSGWQGPQLIGAPVKSMVDLVKAMVYHGVDVRIFTARVGPSKDNANECRYAVQLWCESHLGFALPVTHAKDYLMYAFFDDRAIQVYPNTGLFLEDHIMALEASRDYWIGLIPVEKRKELLKSDPYRRTPYGHNQHAG